jgi:putative tryptophan/tyrosine transport system substrate-binding protein
MRRRELIVSLVGAAAWPLSMRAQQPVMPVIGFLSITSRDTFAPRMAAFRKGLAETGYVENRNVAIEYRWADDAVDGLPALANDLARLQVAVIATGGGAAPALAAKAATARIPVVFAMGPDPVRLGLVASFNQPGGNVTGVTFLISDLGAKQLEFLHEMVPGAMRVGFLVNPDNPNAETEAAQAQAAAHALGKELLVVNASTEGELENAFATLGRQRVRAVIVSPNVFFFGRRDQIVALAVSHTMAAIYQSREFPEVGGLMSYGTSIDDAYWQAGIYVGHILKGEKPANLPVQQSTRVELVINLRTAKALGLTVPPTLLTRADEVIE